MTRAEVLAVWLALAERDRNAIGPVASLAGGLGGGAGYTGKASAPPRVTEL